MFSALANQWTKKSSTLSTTKASMLTYILFNGRAMHQDEVPQQDWDVFYERLVEDVVEEAVEEVVEVEATEAAAEAS